MNFGGGKSWSAQSTPEMRIERQAATSHRTTPAIIQKAELSESEQFKRTARQLYTQLSNNMEAFLPLMESFSLGKWKEFGATRDLASIEVFGAGWNNVKKKYSYWACNLSKFEADKADDDRQETLNKLAALPVPMSISSTTNEEEKMDTPPEKPAVQAATPQQMKPKEAPKHSENGKPKHLLAIWRELEESHFGRALNRIDELNRQCPNAKFHVELIAADKRCLAILEQWKKEITHL